MSINLNINCPGSLLGLMNITQKIFMTGSLNLLNTALLTSRANKLEMVSPTTSKTGSPKGWAITGGQVSGPATVPACLAGMAAGMEPLLLLLTRGEALVPTLLRLGLSSGLLLLMLAALLLYVLLSAGLLSLQVLLLSVLGLLVPRLAPSLRHTLGNTVNILFMPSMIYNITAAQHRYSLYPE